MVLARPAGTCMRRLRLPETMKTAVWPDFVDVRLPKPKVTTVLLQKAHNRVYVQYPNARFDTHKKGINNC